MSNVKRDVILHETVGGQEDMIEDLALEMLKKKTEGEAA